MSQVNSLADAQAVLVQRLHAPVFFDKLARVYGIVPQSPEEEVALLEMASMLQHRQVEQQAKQASAGHSPIIEAVDTLKQELAYAGAPYAAPTSYEQAVVKMANTAVQDESIANAALVYLEHMAKQVV